MMSDGYQVPVPSTHVSLSSCVFMDDQEFLAYQGGLGARIILFIGSLASSFNFLVGSHSCEDACYAIST
jgi:hypothetical protein